MVLTLVPFEGRGRRGRGIVPLDQRNQRSGRQKRVGKIILLPANYLPTWEEEREKVLQELAPVVTWELRYFGFLGGLTDFATDFAMGSATSAAFQIDCKITIPFYVLFYFYVTLYFCVLFVVLHFIPFTFCILFYVLFYVLFYILF